MYTYSNKFPICSQRLAISILNINNPLKLKHRRGLSSTTQRNVRMQFPQVGNLILDNEHTIQCAEGARSKSRISFILDMLGSNSIDLTSSMQQGVWNLSMNCDIKDGPFIRYARFIMQLVITLNHKERGLWRQAPTTLRGWILQHYVGFVIQTVITAIMINRKGIRRQEHAAIQGMAFQW